MNPLNIEIEKKLLISLSKESSMFKEILDAITTERSVRWFIVLNSLIFGVSSNLNLSFKLILI